MGYFRDRHLHLFISATGLQGPRHKLHLSVEHGVCVRYRFLVSHLGAERAAAFPRVRDVAASLHRDGNVVVRLVSSRDKDRIVAGSLRHGKLRLPWQVALRWIHCRPSNVPCNVEAVVRGVLTLIDLAILVLVQLTADVAMVGDGIVPVLLDDAQLLWISELFADIV